MDFDYEKYKDGSYNFIVNGDGDLAVVIGAREGIEVDANIAKIIYNDSDSGAILVRNKNSLSMFEDLPDEVCEMFKDGRQTITVIEVTENTEPNSYEVPIEMKEE